MSATLRQPSGSAFPTRAPRRWFFLLGAPYAIVPSLAAVAYAFYDVGPWVLLTPFVWFFMIIPALDAIVPKDETNPPEESIEALEADRFYTHVAYLMIPFYLANVVLGIMVLVQGMPIWAMIPFLYALGISSGGILTYAHELGHRTNNTDRQVAKIALGLIGYGHFCIEHNRGHHVHVATPEDCSSARFNENVYAFALRDIPGAFMGGWRHEAKRLRNRKEPLFSHHNEILQSYAITFVIGVGLIAWLGWIALPFIVVHHLLAFFTLTLVNYIEHYGLKREKLPSGRYEPCQPRHSWNTNHTVSNIFVINLQRHSDHHANPQRPYQCLRNFEDIPELPSGYPGCISLSLFPPLWFKVMNPKVLAWAGGDESKLNHG